jgi:DNA-binding transcriptional MerR regulator
MRDERLFTVTEVCQQIGTKPHILRYWEKELGLKVRRNSAGRRVFTPAQVERLREVKRLVATEKLTIEGARRRLHQSANERVTDGGLHQSNLSTIIDELRAIEALLDSGESR